MEKVRVLYEYQSEGDNELSLVKGEIITVCIKEDSGWAEGIKTNGQRGWFSLSFVENYVEPAPSPVVTPTVTPSPTATPTSSPSSSKPLSPRGGVAEDVKLRDSKDKKTRRPISSRLMFSGGKVGFYYYTFISMFIIFMKSISKNTNNQLHYEDTIFSTKRERKRERNISHTVDRFLNFSKQKENHKLLR